MAAASVATKATPQGSVVPGALISSADAWTAAQYAEPGTNTLDARHLDVLTGQHIQELDAAVASSLAKHGADNIQAITKEDFPLPTLGAWLERVRDQVTSGRGFALIRGVPVERYTRAEAVAAYWGIGLYLGKAVSQNKLGHLVGHIKDIGGDSANPLTRLYTTHAAQPYHNDASDIVTLLCLKNARSGGLSAWSSSSSVYNKIASTHPHLVPVLAGPWFFDRKGEVPPGKKPFFEIPVFNFHAGYLSVNFSSNYYFLSQRHEEVPRLTPEHYEAIRVFEEYAASDELRLEYLLQPGEIQVLSNHTQLHSRSEFHDYDDFDQRRHLLRLWIAPPQERELPAVYEEIYGGPVTVGARGGIKVEGTTEKIALEAE